MRRPAASAAAALAAALLAACGGGDSMNDASGSAAQERPAASVVTIERFAYSPKTLEVAAGTEVTVINEDDAVHTLTATDGSFDSGSIDGGDEGTVTVEEPGEHAYFCEIHQYMRGSITVR